MSEFGLLSPTEAAARLGVETRKLAELERAGVLVPLRTKGASGWRRYREWDVETLADLWAERRLSADRLARAEAAERVVERVRAAVAG